MDNFTTGMDMSALKGIFAVAGGVSFVLCVLMIVCHWKIFTKAGEKGWKCLIPFYNIWTQYKIICGRGKAMFRLLIPFYNIYWMIKTNLSFADCYGYTAGMGVLLIFVPIVAYPMIAFSKYGYEGPVSNM